MASLSWASFSGSALAAEAGRIDIVTALSALLSSHPAISGKKAEVEAKAFNSDAARAARYPSFNAQAGVMDSTNRQSNSNYTMTLRARQPLWAFGRIDDSIAFADASVLAEKQDLLRVKRGLLEQAVLAYARTFDLNLRQDVLKSSIENLSQLHKQVGRREAGQLASKVDVRLAALRLGQARAQKTNVDDQFLVALNELQTLTQLSSITSVEAVDAELVHLPESVDDVIDIVANNSAEIQYKKALVNLAKADSEREITSSLPTIYFQADKTFNNIGSNRNETRFGVTLDASLDGMGLAMYSNSKAASARERAANDSLRAAQNDVAASVRSLMSSRKVRDEFLQHQQQAVTDLQAIFESYTRQYEAGNKSWLEVLNIERELMDQLLLLAQARSDWLQYTLRLAVLTGSFDNFPLQ